MGPRTLPACGLRCDSSLNPFHLVTSGDRHMRRRLMSTLLRLVRSLRKPFGVYDRATSICDLSH